MSEHPSDPSQKEEPPALLSLEDMLARIRKDQLPDVTDDGPVGVEEL